MPKGIVITREVSQSIENCQLSHIERNTIDLEKARLQHSLYIAAIEAAEWSVLNLPEQPHLPDSVFVEDTAIILSELAVITRPGAETRPRGRFD